jgi:hypothetical protein
MKNHGYSPQQLQDSTQCIILFFLVPNELLSIQQLAEKLMVSTAVPLARVCKGIIFHHGRGSRARSSSAHSASALLLEVLLMIVPTHSVLLVVKSSHMLHAAQLSFTLCG